MKKFVAFAVLTMLSTNGFALSCDKNALRYAESITKFEIGSNFTVTSKVVSSTQVDEHTQVIQVEVTDSIQRTFPSQLTMGSPNCIMLSFTRN